MASLVNRQQIQITSGIFMEFMTKDVQGKIHTANVVVYSSLCNSKFYSSRDGCIKLVFINSDFPYIGTTIQSCAVHE